MISVSCIVLYCIIFFLASEVFEAAQKETHKSVSDNSNLTKGVSTGDHLLSQLWRLTMNTFQCSLIIYSSSPKPRPDLSLFSLHIITVHFNHLIFVSFLLSSHSPCNCISSHEGHSAFPYLRTILFGYRVERPERNSKTNII